MNENAVTKYPHPALTVDCVVFGYDGQALKVLLIKRNIEPFKNTWALPGGFVRMNETIEETAIRELKEETNIEKIYLEQLYTFGGLDRDPRGRTVTVAYYALINLNNHNTPVGGTDASEAKWFDVFQLPDLAFDHALIFDVALKRLQAKLRYEPIGFELLPEEFPFSALEKLYTTILQREIDRRNFRKKIMAMGVIKKLNKKQENVTHRKGFYYSFDRKMYDKLKKKGFNFEI